MKSASHRVTNLSVCDYSKYALFVFNSCTGSVDRQTPLDIVFRSIPAEGPLITSKPLIIGFLGFLSDVFLIAKGTTIL